MIIFYYSILKEVKSAERKQYVENCILNTISVGNIACYA